MDPDLFSYSPIIDRPVIRWPNDARVALWVAPNIEHYEFLPPHNDYQDPWPRVPHPDVMSYAQMDYGNRIGFWRLLEVFDRYDIRCTPSLNVAILEHYPEIRDAMLQRNWDYMSHGIYNTQYLFGMSEEEERAFYQDTSDTLMKYTGKRLKGMLGPAVTNTERTPELMAEAGLIYHADWFHDDQPFPLNVHSGRLISMPYTMETNDAATYLFYGAFRAEYFNQIIKDQFDMLYQQGAHSGRVMCIALHPNLMGQPFRIGYLDDAFAYIKSHDGVWYATADEIAEYYMTNYYDQVVAYVAAKNGTA